MWWPTSLLHLFYVHLARLATTCLHICSDYAPWGARCMNFTRGYAPLGCQMCAFYTGCQMWRPQRIPQQVLGALGGASACHCGALQVSLSDDYCR